MNKPAPTFVSPLVAALAAFVLVLSSTLTVRAAPATERAATDGVDRVYHDYSGEGDASSLELNPALLSTVRGLDFTVLGYDTTSRFTRGQGVGAFAALGLGFGLGLGLGVQTVSPGFAGRTADFAADRNRDFTKLSLGLSGGRSEYGTFGVTVHGIRPHDGDFVRPDLDFGLMSRIFNYASVGAVARLSPVDLRSDVVPSEFSVIGELAVRPLGTHHFEIAGGVKSRVMEADPGEALDTVGTPGLLPRGRISFRYQGVAIRGEVEQVRTAILDDVDFSPLGEDKAVRGSISLETSWDFASIGGGVHAGVSDGIDGYGLHARIHSSPRGRVFWGRPVDILRVELSDIVDQRSLIGTLEALRRAQKDGKRTILLLDARAVAAGWASLHELREHLIAVRNAGGHVFAYVEHASLKDYYMASVAQRVFIHPAGGLETYGISQTGLYFKDALDKVGVKAEVIKIKEYKSAGERFDRTGPSPEDVEQRKAILAGTYDQVIRDIAQGRSMTRAQVRALFDDAPRAPEQALSDGLVDDVLFRDELEKRISDEIGAQVEFKTFFGEDPADETWARAPYVAVVLVEDTIIDGRSRNIPFLNLAFAGGDTIAETLRTVRKDPFCRGIVLRVDSPGGSALASDIIWREVARTHEAYEQEPRDNPPIVVSMSNVAASGGYYVSMGTDTILADPMTITGSIGVLSIHFDISGLLTKLGISTSTFKEGKNPDVQSIFKPYTEDQRERVEASIGQTYDLFTSRVATARTMTQDRVNELGRGHVYTGTDAKKVGLVDQMGGLYDAIAIVREKAGVAKFRRLELRVVPRRVRLLDLILRGPEEPFAGAGPIRKLADRRRARKEAEARQGLLPLVLDEALSRLPLSLLYLPQGQAHALTPWLIPRN